MTIYCVGRNYVLHALELGNKVPTAPIIFLKAESSLRSLTDSVLAFPMETFHYELEIVLTIAKDFNLNEKVTPEAFSFISLGIDLTRREVQTELKKQGLPWTTSKSFAGSALVGKRYPYAPYAKMTNINFELKVNDVLVQKGESQLMIYPFIELANFLNTFSPLKKGDLIFTGTPEGVGPIRRGDKIAMKLENEISEIGQL